MNRRLLVVSGILLAFALVIRLVPFQRAIPLRQPFNAFPLEWKGWTGRGEEFTPEILENLGVHDYMSRNYVRDGKRVGLYVGYYEHQGAGVQIHSPKHCLPGSGWFRVSEGTREFDVGGVGRVRAVEAVYAHGADRTLFVYWYRMRNSCITNEYLLKLAMITNSLRYRRNEATFVRLSTPVEPDLESAREVARGFMGDFLPVLAKHLPD